MNALKVTPFSFGIGAQIDNPKKEATIERTCEIPNGEPDL